MNIPPPCRSWEQLLAGAEDGCAILANVRLESCVPAASEVRFFSDLSVSLTQAPPAASADAIQASADVVFKARAALLYLGTRAKDFVELGRLQRPSNLVHCIPEERREDFASAGGLTADNLKDIDCDALSLLLEGYDGPVDTANTWGFAWGTAMEEVLPVLENNPPELPNRLGLPGWEQERCGVFLAYLRNEVAGMLHVPRVFEGMNFPPFSLVTDCAADSGRTKPLSGDPGRGFAEVVHSGCRVQPSRFEVVLLTK